MKIYNIYIIGKTVYFGEISNVDKYFKDHLNKECPKNASLAEWMLDEVNGDFSSNEIILGYIEAYEKYNKDVLNKI
jgi:hypothetical protein